MYRISPVRNSLLLVVKRENAFTLSFDLKKNDKFILSLSLTVKVYLKES